MLPHDYNHYLFTASTTDELEQHLLQIQTGYETDESCQAFRIFKHLQKLAQVRKGLRLDTKYGLASYCGKGDPNVMRVRFDGDISSTGISPNSIRTFWFEMD